MAKSKVESHSAAKKDLNERDYAQLKYYKQSSDQSYLYESNMSSDKSSDEIWQPEKSKLKSSPKPKT